jgi:hypothetical protein
VPCQLLALRRWSAASAICADAAAFHLGKAERKETWTTKRAKPFSANVLNGFALSKSALNILSLLQPESAKNQSDAADKVMQQTKRPR